MPSYCNKTLTRCSHPMPAGGMDTGDFGNFGGDTIEYVVGDAEDIDLDMKHAGEGELGRHLAGHYIQILEALEHSGECAGIGVSDHSQTTQRKFVG